MAQCTAVSELSSILALEKQLCFDKMDKPKFDFYIKLIRDQSGYRFLFKETSRRKLLVIVFLYRTKRIFAFPCLYEKL